MTVSKRKAITTRTRFEVFKRDSFKCQYCGAKAPDVLLEVDHINPVANGGTNDILNLVTACQDCNGGKSDKLLCESEAMDKKRSQLEQLQDRREQLDMMFQWQEGLSNITTDVVERLKDKWREHTGYSLSDSGCSAMRKLVKKYPIEDIFDAIEVAADAYLRYGPEGVATHDSVEVAWGKVAGICHNKIIQRKDPDLREINHIRAILRKRFSFNEGHSIAILRRAIACHADIDGLKSFAATAKYWSHFRDGVEAFCEEQEAKRQCQ